MTRIEIQGMLCAVPVMDTAPMEEPPVVVLVHGPPGVGKSTLIQVGICASISLTRAAEAQSAASLDIRAWSGFGHWIVPHLVSLAGGCRCAHPPLGPKCRCLLHPRLPSCRRQPLLRHPE